MPEAGLQTCPDCGEDLTAVQPPGRCATCGFEFDEQTRVWRPTRTWHHHSVLYGVLGLAAGLLVTVGYRLEFDEVPNPLLPIAAAIGVAVLGLIMDRVLVGRMSDRFVALTPVGVLIGTRRRSRLVPWGDVAKLRIRAGRVPRLECQSEGVTIPLEDLFDTPTELAAFRDAFDQGRRRHKQQPTEQD